MNFKLKAAIVEKYGTQSDFSKVSGIPEPEISRLIRGRRDPSPALKDKIASKLGTNPRDLFPED